MRRSPRPIQWRIGDLCRWRKDQVQAVVYAVFVVMGLGRVALARDGQGREYSIAPGLLAPERLPGTDLFQAELAWHMAGSEHLARNQTLLWAKARRQERRIGNLRRARVERGRALWASTFKPLLPPVDAGGCVVSSLSSKDTK